MNSLGIQSNPVHFQTETSPTPTIPETDVFRYEDYRAYLRDRFAEMQMLHPGFSQRGLARKAGIANPGFFNEVIKGRRRLSPAAALKMAFGLDLPQEQKDFFCALIEFTETREPRAKLAVSQRLNAMRDRKSKPAHAGADRSREAPLETALGNTEVTVRS